MMFLHQPSARTVQVALTKTRPL